jgi:protocatechuate 3,4-dioxygenase beta subunit
MTKRWIALLFLPACVLSSGPAFPAPAPDSARLAVRVVDRSGAPLSGAIVHAGTKRLSLSEIYQEETSAEGTVRFEDLPAEMELFLSVERDGFAPVVHDQGPLRPGALRETRVTLRPGGISVGRVVDEAGRPVAGVQVSLLTREVLGLPADGMEEALRDLFQVVRSTETDAAGVLRFDDLAEGRFDLSLDHPSYAPVRRKDLTVRSGESADLGRFVLRGGTTLTGTVTDPDGRPLEGVALYARTRLSDPMQPTFPAAPPTGPDGAFEISHLPSGKITLSAILKGYVTELFTIERFGEPLHLTLRPAEETPILGPRLRGRVIGPDGAPLEGAWVGSGEHPGHMAGADGWFELPTLSWEPTTIWVTKDGFAAAEIEMVPVESEIEALQVRLERGTTVTGRLLGLRRTETAYLEVTREGSLIRPGTRADLHQYSILDLGPGAWTISANLYDGNVYTRSLTRRIEVPPGVPAMELDLDFTAAETEPLE